MGAAEATTGPDAQAAIQAALAQVQRLWVTDGEKVAA